MNMQEPIMKDIYRGTILPKRRMLVRLGWIFSCPVDGCEYERSFEREEEARTAKLMHCKTTGGTAHDRLIVDHLWDESPLSR